MPNTAISIPSNGSKYTHDIKHAFIANYLVKGNCKAVAISMGLPVKTCDSWLRTEWGEALIAKLQDEKDAELDAIHTNIIHAAQEQVIDRIENGDFKLDKNNEIIRLGMDGKALATVAAITFDKRQISRNLPTSINSSMDNAALNKLQQQFQQLSKQSKVIEGEVIENDDNT